LRRTLAFLLTLLPAAAAAQTTPIWRISHQATAGGTYTIAHGPDLSQTTPLKLIAETAGPKNGSNTWAWAHVDGSDGSGWKGRNYLRFTRWADTNGDPDEGFAIPWNRVAPPGGWASLAASPICLRCRLYVEAPLTRSGRNDSAQMKWFIFGGPGLPDGTSRAILFFERATDGTYGAGRSDAREITVRLGAGVGSSFTGVAVPVGRWHHLQVCWRYGAGTGYQRLYLNTNTEDAPTAQRSKLTWTYPPSFSSTLWGSITATNAYTGSDAIFRVMDVELDDAFDPAWAPAADAGKGR
jgi:hypothetical protein